MKETKFCPGCRKHKTLGEFHKNNGRADGLQCYCKTCFKVRYGNKTPEEKRRSHIERYYGISWETYISLLDRQNGCCAICGVSIEALVSDKLKTAHVDHDHETDTIRGLLCHFCNSGLGYFRDDSELLTKAVYYLAKKTIPRDLELPEVRRKQGYAKISKALTGKKLSPEHIEAISLSHRGKPNPKSGESRKGRSLSVEHRKKLSVAVKAYWAHERDK